MKAKFLFLMFVVAAESIAAQKEERSSKQLKIVVEGSAVKDTTIKGNQDDTLHIRLGDMKIDIYPDSTSKLATTDKKCKSLPIEDFPWYGFEGFRFGFLTFMDANQNSYEPEWLQNQGKRNSSGYLGIGIINTSFELIEDRFRLGTGLGLTRQTIAINRNLRLAEADTFGFQSASFPVSELATLNSSYLTVPLVFQYNGKVTEQDRKDLWMNEERNIFHVSFGIIGGYRISSSALYKWKENGDKRKQRVAEIWCKRLYVEFIC